MLILSIFTALTMSARAEVPAKVLTFEEAARVALEDNADILAIRENEASIKHHASQALAPNSPVVSYSANNSSAPLSFNQAASRTYGLAWTLGFPGKAILQSRQLDLQAASSREQSLEKEVGILTSLSNLYISLSANTQLIRILEQEQNRTGETLKIIEHKYALGQASQVDLLSSRSAIAKLGNDLLYARESSKVLQAQFLTLIRKPESDYVAADNSSIDVPVLHLTLEELIQMLLRNRHAVLASKLQSDSTSSAATLANVQWLPDLTFTAAMTLYKIPAAQANPDLSRDYTLGFQLSLPIFYPVNELNSARAARADRMAAEFQADSVRLQAISDLKSNWTLYQSGMRQLHDLQTLLLPATKASYELTLKSYSLGKADYLRLTDARNNWISTQRDELSKRSDLAQLFNLITLNVGCDFKNPGSPHACQ